jgi:hypothetical protein
MTTERRAKTIALLFCFFALKLLGLRDIFRKDEKDFEAKIFDLRRFSKNTRYCGIACKKIAYMVKFGQE